MLSIEKNIYFDFKKWVNMFWFKSCHKDVCITWGASCPRCTTCYLQVIFGFEHEVV